MLWILLLTLSGACGSGEAAAVRAEMLTRYPAPEDGVQGQICTDLGAIRVCWHGLTARVVPRVLPAPVGLAPPRGWRCGGEGRDRVCEDRGRNSSGFDCGTTRCLQARPRMPDDGEWECVEVSGVVFCRSRGEMAGLQAGPMDLGWLCGPRLGASGERICVDFDVDRPIGEHATMGATCRFEWRFGVPARSCTASPAPRVGSPCTSASVCPEGSRCMAGLCLPPLPQPSCFFDRDCEGDARCVFGSCRKA